MGDGEGEPEAELQTLFYTNPHVAQPQCKCLKDPDQASQKHLSPLPSSPSLTHYIGYLL
ncbi:hypothetical protein CROQUDRAFT_99793 [Cronartium quercuum f. sp. fusiforme G11]|uniref:Uncharacterized protein n=1 Tax=Cronartium quercuum f. sp. fusiforme G11 TaxID=708437 RepID=A0A9P6NBG3_9BASI|nr:hypothetical protein CROQUDRAFT_99793 [Cronartium quercuum f. sp. fusiforme G11]